MAKSAREPNDGRQTEHGDERESENGAAHRPVERQHARASVDARVAPVCALKALEDALVRVSALLALEKNNEYLFKALDFKIRSSSHSGIGKRSRKEPHFIIKAWSSLCSVTLLSVKHFKRKTLRLILAWKTVALMTKYKGVFHVTQFSLFEHTLIETIMIN